MTLAKIQVTAFFLMEDMQRNFFPQLFIDLYGDPILVPYRDGHKHGGRKPAETSVTEFATKG